MSAWYLLLLAVVASISVRVRRVRLLLLGVVASISVRVGRVRLLTVVFIFSVEEQVVVDSVLQWLEVTA
jgi:hypothetical protein